MLGASTVTLSKDIDKYAFMCGSIFYDTDVNRLMYEAAAANRAVEALKSKARRRR